MLIRGVVPLYPPHSLVGSWITTHEFLRHMVGRGHDVRVVAYLSSGRPWPFADHDGVIVEPHFRQVGSPAPDVVIGHVGDDGSAQIVADRAGVPLVMMVHGGRLEVIRDKLEHCALAVFNSESLRQEIGWDGAAVVAHPPVNVTEYATTPGDRVTLVNLSMRKGAHVFWELAKALPDVGFLGVRGAYGEQVQWGGYPNVKLQRPTANMAGDVYARTRILLMPSEVETWGRVGIEAACSGIPTIAHPTDGIIEALGDAAIYMDRDDIDGWIAAVTRLQEPAAWKQASTAARRRLRTWRPADELERFATAVEGVRACALSS